MTKGFYRFMCMATAAAMSIIGCGPEKDPPLEYGPGPTDYDETDKDEYPDNPLYGDVQVDFDNSAMPDADEPVVVPDDPAVEYGPYPTDYDDAKPDADQILATDDPALEYGPYPTDYDAAGTDAIIEQPDEMTTDYGPIAQPFKKK